MTDYACHDIRVLEGLEHVRARPAMYIGGTDRDGLHVMVVEALGEPFEGALAGHVTRVQLRLGADGGVTVEDDGEGVAVTPDPRARRSTGSPFEQRLLVMGAGGWLRCRRLHHGVGPEVINALSSRLEAETAVDGGRWRLVCERGRATAPLERLGPATERGNRLRFTPDPELFVDTRLDADRLMAELRWRSALTPEVTWELLDERTPRRRLTLRSPRGLADLVQAVAEGPLLARPLSTRSAVSADGRRVELALTRQAGQATRVLGFVDGLALALGDHVTGLLEGLRAGLAEAGGVTAPWPLRGLVAAVAVQAPEPSFAWELVGGGSTLASERIGELAREEARGLVTRWARANPTLFRRAFA